MMPSFAAAHRDGAHGEEHGEALLVVRHFTGDFSDGVLLVPRRFSPMAVQGLRADQSTLGSDVVLN